MSAIRQALMNLDQAVGELEDSLSALENNLVGAQRDMFPDAKAAVVKSLDSMINHVETMLESA